MYVLRSTPSDLVVRYVLVSTDVLRRRTLHRCTFVTLGEDTLGCLHALGRLISFSEHKKSHQRSNNCRMRGIETRARTLPLGKGKQPRPSCDVTTTDGTSFPPTSQAMDRRAFDGALHAPRTCAFCPFK